MYNKEVIVVDCKYDKQINGKLGYIAGTSEDDFGSVVSYGIFIFDEGYVVVMEKEEFRLTGKVYDESELLTGDHLRVSRDGKIL